MCLSRAERWRTAGVHHRYQPGAGHHKELATREKTGLRHQDPSDWIHTFSHSVFEIGEVPRGRKVYSLPRRSRLAWRQKCPPLRSRDRLSKVAEKGPRRTRLPVTPSAIDAAWSSSAGKVCSDFSEQLNPSEKSRPFAPLDHTNFLKKRATRAVKSACFRLQKSDFS